LDIKKQPVSILIADDDEDDRFLAKEALREARLMNELDFVEDGEELMDYLLANGKYEYRKDSPLPGFVLLDLNMPKKDGREALKEIKADPGLKDIPIAVLTTSRTEEDIYRSYNLGVNAFISKPISLEGLIEVLKTLSLYGITIVDIPSKNI